MTYTPEASEVVEVLEKCLPSFLARQRWYPAKALGSRVIRPLFFKGLTDSQENVYLSAWESIGERDFFTFFLPLISVCKGHYFDGAEIAKLASGKILIDALASAEFIEVFINSTFRSDRECRDVIAHLDANHLNTVHRNDIIPLKLEQSNSSIRIGDWAVIKFFRKLVFDIQPEVEVGRFIRTYYPDLSTSKLVGWHEWIPNSGSEPPVISVLHEFVPNHGNGWDWLLAHLVSGRPDAPILWIEIVGRELAALHAAFSNTTDDAAFAPEPATDADRRTWLHNATVMANTAFRALSDHCEGELLEPINRLSRHMPSIEQHLDGLLPKRLNFNKTRYHGDLVVGQILVTKNGHGAVLTDFEGEPLRSIVERRAKYSPLRDVAGVIRSIHYAEAVSLRKGVSVRSDWAKQVSQRFLTSYFHHIKGAGIHPTEPGELRSLVRFFVIEKAFYEVRYELAYRPSWLIIPLEGLLGLLEEGN